MRILKQKKKIIEAGKQVMEEKNKKKWLVDGIQSVFFVIVNAGFLYVFSYIYMETEFQILRNVVMGIMGALLVLYVFWSSAVNGKLDYENHKKFGRFTLFYYIGLALVSVFPILPYSGWPFIVIFTALALFGNMACGITAGSVLLMIAVFMTPGMSAEVFVLYFMSGVVAVSLFQNLDETFKVGIPILLSLLFLSVSETANIILFMNERLNIEMFVIPVTNVIISAIMLIALLRIYNHLVTNQYQVKYQVINDQEYPLMVELKEKYKAEYFHTIHTAYLTGRIAAKLNLNENVTKAATYYLKIGNLMGENNWENVRMICKANRFPEEVIKVLGECLDPSRKYIEKETAVVLFADAVIASIQDIFSKNKQAVVDYAELVDGIFQKKIDSGFLSDNLLTYSELQTMKKILREEKLYYDFLR